MQPLCARRIDAKCWGSQSAQRPRRTIWTISVGHTRIFGRTEAGTARPISRDAHSSFFDRHAVKTAGRSRPNVSSFPIDCHPRDEAAAWLPFREDREIINFRRTEGGIRLAFSWQVWPAVAQCDAGQSCDGAVRMLRQPLLRPNCFLRVSWRCEPRLPRDLRRPASRCALGRLLFPSVLPDARGSLGLSGRVLVSTRWRRLFLFGAA